MKTKYLLPNSWRSFGFILTFISMPLAIWMLVDGSNFPITEIPTHLHFRYPDWEMFRNIFAIRPDGTVSFRNIQDLLGLILIIGLFIIGFSKLKVEDERIAQIRLESLQWGIYANYFILFLCIMLVFGTSFFLIMIYNIFTPLLIFITRFYWLLLVQPAIEAKKERRLS